MQLTSGKFYGYKYLSFSPRAVVSQTVGERRGAKSEKIVVATFTMEEMKSYLTMLKSRIDLTQQLVKMP